MLLTRVICAWLFALLPPQGMAAAAPGCATAPVETVRVATVLDGDTLRLADGREVRIAGIASAKASNGADAALRELAALAGRTLAEFSGAAVMMAPVGAAADRYGRRHVVLETGDGRGVAESLVASGLARVRLFPGEERCLAPLLAAEAEARTAGRGLWALPAFAVRRATDGGLLDHVGQFELVEGRIASVGHGRSVVFLDFGRDYRRDFTIMVPQSVSRRFVLPVDGLKGRRVRVRGVIEASGGPAIWLSDPIEIEILDEDNGGGSRG